MAHKKHGILTNVTWLRRMLFLQSGMFLLTIVIWYSNSLNPRSQVLSYEASLVFNTGKSNDVSVNGDEYNEIENLKDETNDRSAAGYGKNMMKDATNNKDSFDNSQNNFRHRNIGDSIDWNVNNEWRLDWRFYRRHLGTSDQSSLMKNEKTGESLPILNINNHHTGPARLSQTIIWNNSKYFGYCRSYFYSQLAFVHIGHENGIRMQSEKHLFPFFHKYRSFFIDNNFHDSTNFPFLSDISSSTSKYDEFLKLLNGTITQFSDDSNDRTYNGQLHRFEPIKYLLDQSVRQYNSMPLWIHDSFDYYNSSNINYNPENAMKNLERLFNIDSKNQRQENKSDALRVERMRNVQTKYRFDSVVFTHNPLRNEYIIEIIVARNCPDKDFDIRFKSIVYDKNNDGIKRHERLYYPKGTPGHPKQKWVMPKYENIDAGIENNRFLCVFSNGISVVSNAVRRGNEMKQFVSHFIIECDISNEPSILKHLLNDENGQAPSGVDNQARKSPIITNLGLTLFSLLYKESSDVLYNEYLISLNTQLPVCSTLEVNRKAEMYENSMHYHSKLSKDYHQVVPIVNSMNSGNSEDNFDEASLLKSVLFPNSQMEYYLSATTFIHPASRSGQVDLLVKQWIDYHLFQGFNHFYLWDHLLNREETDISLFYDTLLPYIESKTVTLIQWPVTMKSKERRNYEVSGYLDAVRRFRYNTKFLSMFDIDEWIMVLPKNTSHIYDGDRNVTEIMNQKGKGYKCDEANNCKYGSMHSDQVSNSLQKMPTLSDIIAMSNNDYAMFVLIAYTAMQDLFGIWRGTNKQGKILGCLTDDHSMMDENLYHYDTFMERQSCLDYKLQNTETIGKFLYNLKLINNQSDFDATNFDEIEVFDQLREKMSSYPLIQDRKKLDSWIMKSDPRLEDTISLKALNNRRKSETQRIYDKIMVYFDYLNEDRWWLGFQMTPKLLINPMIAYCGYQHDMSLYNTRALIPPTINEKTYIAQHSGDENENVNNGRRRLGRTLKEMIAKRHESQSDDVIKDMILDEWQPNLWQEMNPQLSEKYDIILLHTTDHWRTLGFYHRDENKMIDFKDKEDMKLFYETIGSKCDYQGYILEWNKQFINSKYGNKWKNNHEIEPLFDENGLFCYDTDPNYAQKWADEN